MVPSQHDFTSSLHLKIKFFNLSTSHPFLGFPDFVTANNSNVEVGKQWSVDQIQSAACYCKILLWQPSPFYSVWPLVCFVSQSQSWVTITKTIWLTNLTICVICLCTEKSWLGPVSMYQRAGRNLFVCFASICRAWRVLSTQQTLEKTFVNK